MTGRSPAEWKILDIQNQALHCNDMVSLVYNSKIRLITGGPRMDSGGEGEQRCRGDLANRLIRKNGGFVSETLVQSINNDL